ncbi:hypothetical protein [Pseudomonas putida]|uniref:Uncharacterized protein n=1 Tax=Pseudomonas putida TaxID=303 RepID=A0A8I1E9J4_PSEPU|nr:hypothetical protein [Pseudomonas putida]MBI6882315.1 hypothetical protein [Pseudomonas putida]
MDTTITASSELNADCPTKMREKLNEKLSAVLNASPENIGDAFLCSKIYAQTVHDFGAITDAERIEALIRSQANYDTRMAEINSVANRQALVAVGATVIVMSLGLCLGMITGLSLANSFPQWFYRVIAWSFAGILAGHSIIRLSGKYPQAVQVAKTHWLSLGIGFVLFFLAPIAAISSRY